LPAAIDFPAMARAAGIRHAESFATLEALEAGLPGLLAAEGPVFAALHIVPGDPSPQDYAYIHSAEARRIFKDALSATP
jgi:hypothetical protein